MGLLNDNITEGIQKQIYLITAKLGSVPSNIRDYDDNKVQVNWVVNDISYMWRSKEMGNEMDWVEIYRGPADISNFYGWVKIFDI